MTLPVIAVVSFTLLAGGCVRRLPAAATPESVAPPLDAAAATAPGAGRLVVEVVDGPTPVHQVRMAPRQVDDGAGRVSFRFDESTELLCAASPCVADVATGNILLGFPVIGDRDAMEIELVHVGPDPSVYRRSLSVYRDDSGAVGVLGIVGASVGGAALITGVVLLPIGLAKDNDGLATAGGITLGVGAALLALGVWAIRHDAPTFRPGSSNHFPLLTPGPGGAP